MSKTNDFLSTLDSVVDAATANQSIKPADARPMMNTEAFQQVIESRRSVRVFTGEAIPESVMHKLIDAAMLAPSSSNLQPWEFHWVRSRDKKSALVQMCLSQPAAKTAGELLVIVARTNTWRRNIKEMLRVFSESKEKVPKGVLLYYQKLIPKALQTGPVGTFAVLKWLVTRVWRYQRPTPQEPIGHSDVRIWAHKSVALAAENLMLAARAHNLDSCPMEGFDSWRVKKLLNLPRGAEISMVVALGKAKPEGIYGPRLRFDRKWFVFEH